MIIEHNHSWAYALFSAHLHRYLPALKWEDHLMVYEKWKSVHIPKPMASTCQWERSFIQEWDVDTPHIICLYHLGMHAQIPRVLAEQGFCFDILMDRHVFEKQQTPLIQLQTELNRNEREYRFLMSDDPQVLLKARTAIKKGKHLLVFADGNSGTSESLNKKVRIDFLAADIYVRKGIALLSFLLQIPVIPITHVFINDDYYSVVAGNRICVQPYENRDCYITRCMQQVYDFLAIEISRSPWNWECWSYLHEMNCYSIAVPTIKEIGEQNADAGIIHIQLAGEKGVFYRKYFCYSRR
ncbi:hypothetical protein [Sphingobacterium sp. UDSM-2020]|uniref:LpxL/LpxP family acyltransferase n=1 Tax=Sphingobacterium sp. UDSM-2020 TaxID=2795738 RepID=UPI0019362416|nr:hypothetical protein [Sphingobacterium sp. UDSM-2020]QQD11634.1 hypothetical protein JAZ75_13435 [Sphingobacterium sp. UDSM-2020]